MKEGDYEIKEIKIKGLIPYNLYSSQVYQGERLKQLVNSIERPGLMNLIIVRPVVNEKYESIFGHSRTRAMESMGSSEIRAVVRSGLSDEEAIELFYDSNLNQQSFSDWSYAQKIEAIKYSEKMIRKNSQQGRRTDLEKKTEEKSVTFVQCRQKSSDHCEKSTTRDKMARRLGIATVTLSKYRSIIKLPNDLIDAIARLLDQKKISFEAAYRMSGLRPCGVRMLVDYIKNQWIRRLIWTS